MSLFVIDTSVVAKVLLTHQLHSDIALSLFECADKGELELISPSLLLFELNNVLVREGYQPPEIHGVFEGFLEQVETGMLRIIHPQKDILHRTREIACLRTNGQGHISSYDATFHALAILENATYITADERHYNKTVDTIGSVMLLRDF